eukprot:CAMPEP_0113636742 /NCGR_PEP_ID=MMETSP0017_2-20120614/19189_1 /TAXON_ID=2856 /ORGANISM="Cylindrotheca closterium" /LENGTH=564 /DNA_ID=CAMNT_0000547651 /DNA_START=110 /DNA_END=1804 /DNA_ORIENTATION=- /assembly_acc=CAM_ASM_000147
MNRSLDEAYPLSRALIPRKPSLIVREQSQSGASQSAPILASQQENKSKQSKPKKKKFTKKRPQNGQSTILNNVSSNMTTIDKTSNLLSTDSAMKKASVAIQGARSDENHHHIPNSKKRARVDNSDNDGATNRGASSETQSTGNQQQQRQTVALSPSVMSREKLQAMVQHFDERDKGEFAWLIHKHHNKKHQTQYWYEFGPPEKYCSSYAFVPVQYNSLIPSDTKKNQIKKKTTSLVLKKGVQGIHFAIGWQELFGMIVEYGIFHDDPFFDGTELTKLVPGRGRLPELIGFEAAPLDLLGTKNKKISPTMGIVLMNENTKQSRRKATQGIKYTTTPSPQEEGTLLIVGGTTNKNKRKKKAAAADANTSTSNKPDDEGMPTVQIKARSATSHSKKKARSDSSNNHNPKKAVEKESLRGDPTLLEDQEKEPRTKSKSSSTTKSKPAPSGGNLNKLQEQEVEPRTKSKSATSGNLKMVASAHASKQHQQQQDSAESAVDDSTTAEEVDPVGEEGTVKKKNHDDSTTNHTSFQQQPQREEEEEEEPCKYATPPTPPIPYWLEKYGAYDV